LFFSKDSSQASRLLFEVIGKINDGQFGDLDKLRADYRDARDGDTPSRWAIESLNTGDGKMKYYRVLPWTVGFEDGPNGRARMATMIGETMEYALPTAYLYGHARHIASLPADKAKALLVRLLGLPSQQAGNILNFAHPVPLASHPRYEENLASFFAAALGKPVEHGYERAEASVAGAAPRSFVDRLRAILPDRSYGALDQLAPVLSRLGDEQPAAAEKLVSTLEEKIRNHNDDVGSIAYVMAQAVEKLKEKGLEATAASPLPALSDAIIGTIKRINVRMADAATTTLHADFETSAEWAGRRGFLAGAVQEDAMDLDAGAAFGADAQFPGRAGGGPAGRRATVPVTVDESRIPELNKLFATANSNELAILIRILTTDLTPEKIAHFLRCGIQLCNAHATRFSETTLTGNMVSLRAAGQTARVLMTPMMIAVTQRGITGGTDFTFTMTHGVQWIDPFGVGEMPSFFPLRVLHGYNTKWQESTDDLMRQISGRGSTAARLLQPNLTLVTYPLTETRHDTPIHALIDIPSAAPIPGGHRPIADNRCSGYYVRPCF
jgi:hypothetical protein